MNLGKAKYSTTFEPGKAREILDFPQGWQVRIYISFGFPIMNEGKITVPPKKGGRKP
jgi:hypothetical protein